MNKKRKNGGRVFGSRLTATISISLVLLLFAIMMALGLFAHDLSKAAKENIHITILLNDKVQEQELSTLFKRLNTSPWAKSYKYIDKEAAIKELTEELGENPEDLLGYNPLPATIEVLMSSEYTQLEEIKRIETSLLKNDFIQEVVYREDLIQLLNNNLVSIGKLLLAVALLLMFISFFLIRNTVRLMIYSKRFLIHTMCLVGAKRSFIRRPFVLQNARCGVLSAILSMGLFYLSVMSLKNVFPDVQRVMEWEALLPMTFILMILGVFITTLATIFSVNRFLRMEADEMYYV